MRFVLITLLLFVGLSNVTFAQFESEETDLNHSLGLYAGGVSGIGFSYRYLPYKGYGIQLTGIPILRESGSFYGNFGLSFLYGVRRHKNVSVYGFLGNSVNYNRSSYTYSDFDDEQGGVKEITQVETDTDYSLGIGAGVNVRTWEVIDFTFAGGYAFGTNRKKDEFGKSTSIRTNLFLEVGLYYRF